MYLDLENATFRCQDSHCLGRQVQGIAVADQRTGRIPHIQIGIAGECIYGKAPCLPCGQMETVDTQPTGVNARRWVGLKWIQPLCCTGTHRRAVLL